MSPLASCRMYGAVLFLAALAAAQECLDSRVAQLCVYPSPECGFNTASWCIGVIPSQRCVSVPTIGRQPGYVTSATVACGEDQQQPFVVSLFKAAKCREVLGRPVRVGLFCGQVGPVWVAMKRNCDALHRNNCYSSTNITAVATASTTVVQQSEGPVSRATVNVTGSSTTEMAVAVIGTGTSREYGGFSTTSPTPQSVRSRSLVPAIATSMVLVALVIIAFACYRLRTKPCCPAGLDSARRNRKGADCVVLTDTVGGPLSDEASNSAEEQPFMGGNLTLAHRIGEGEFGEVFLAKLDDRAVAMKRPHHAATPEQRQRFAYEARLTASLRHPNVVEVVTCDLASPTPSVTLEYMSGGDLASYLQACSAGALAAMLPQLRGAAEQVASALCYLRSRSIIHRDLAARNILVGQSLAVVKLADFGMSRDVTDRDYYCKQSNDLVPLKWMAPEAIHLRRYSYASDVWSFGIVLWELYSGGQPPYPHLNGYTVLAALLQGCRMSRPRLCPPDVFALMQATWHGDPAARPDISQVLAGLAGTWPPSSTPAKMPGGGASEAQAHTQSVGFANSDYLTEVNGCEVSLARSDKPSTVSATYINVAPPPSGGGPSTAGRAVWANFSMNRYEAANALRGMADGRFILHRHLQDFAAIVITYKQAAGASHMVIHQDKSRFWVDGYPQLAFDSVPALVAHYQTPLATGSKALLSAPMPHMRPASQPGERSGDHGGNLDPGGAPSDWDLQPVWVPVAQKSSAGAEDGHEAGRRSQNGPATRSQDQTVDFSGPIICNEALEETMSRDRQEPRPAYTNDVYLDGVVVRASGV